jgi:hypothetical protein
MYAFFGAVWLITVDPAIVPRQILCIISYTVEGCIPCSPKHPMPLEALKPNASNHQLNGEY